MEEVWKITFSEASVNDIEDCLKQGPLYFYQGQEVRSLNEELVTTIGSLKVHIYSNEHPPPHFHVKFNGEENSFSLIDGEPLYPKNGLKKYFRNINKWFQKNKDMMKKEWNMNRPSNCPAGKI